MTSPRASIVVRCYNEVEHIGRLLHGLYEQTMDDFEVILVDSGSTDGTLDVARQYPIDDVVYIDPAEFSFGRSLNYGCEAAAGEFCVFVSAHVYPRRDDWLETLLAKFEDDDVALVYGKQRGNHVTKYSETQIFKQWFPDHDIDHQEEPFCNNANAAIRRDVWADFPYDEDLTGLEDVDWAKRVQAAGYEISYAADAEIIHVHDETSREIFNRYRREAFAHRQIMSDQSFTIADFVYALVTNIVSDYTAALREGKLLDTVVEIPQFRLLQFAGTYRGFNQEGPMSERLKERFYYPDTDRFPDEERCPDDDTRVIDYSDVD